MQKNLLIAIPFILLGGASYIFHVIIQQWMKWLVQARFFVPSLLIEIP